MLVGVLDQALVQEFQTAYGGYSVGAIVSVGLTWLLGTLLIGIVLDKLRKRLYQNAYWGFRDEPLVIEASLRR